MLKLFRKIRQKLLSENKFSRYLIYATGEIVLVVIGILIALQINNSNENRKNKQSVEIAIQSLLTDLKKDKIQLDGDIKGIQRDLGTLNNYIQRLSSPGATMDTLRHIARFEYTPYFDPSNELNRNTIVSLLSTGKIEFFKDELKSEILQHNSDQLKLLKIMDQNVAIFLSSRNPYVINLQSENSRFESAFVKGELLELYWKNKDDDELLDAMLSSISGKKIMQEIIIIQKITLLEKTNQMIESLENSEKK